MRACLALLIAGCNVVQLQQAAIVRSMRGAGLELHEAELGEDRVRYFHREGEGTPVVLVHGFGGSALWQWSGVVPALEGRPIVAPDLLWFGGSYSPSTDYTLDRQVRTLLALLDERGYSRVDVVGISYGGLVAYELAAAFPDRVRRLVMVASPGRERVDYGPLLRRLGLAHLAELVIPEDARGVERLLGLAYAEPPWLPELVLWQVHEALYGAHRDEQRALLDDLLRTPRRGRHPTAEALVVWGRDDPIFALPIGRRLAERLNARLEIVDRARHAPNVERPARFNEILRRFLDGG